jgi:carboxypeptidase PM20D1
MMYVLLVITLVIIVLVAVVLARTLAFKPPLADRSAQPLDYGQPSQEVLDRLSAAIAIPTIVEEDYASSDFAPFDAYIAWLAEAFPLFHQTCTLERINTYGLAFRWAGSAGAGAGAGSAGDNSSPNANPNLKPIALLAHYDVVPIEAGTEQDWTHPGFSGKVVDGYVWGRGTLDIKSQMIAHLEAAEELIRSGFTPTRDLYFLYGQDEEMGGMQGASFIVEHLQGKGVELEAVLDEGGLVNTGAIKGVDVPVALIGIAEKGHVDYKLGVQGSGGHSSMPPKHSSLGEVARLIAALEAHPLPARLEQAPQAMLRTVAGEMGFVVRMAVANLWLFKPVLLSILSKSPATNAMTRTTFAATMAHASDAPNVLPQHAEANLNVRILPGDTVQSVEAYIRSRAQKLGIPATIQASGPGTDPSATSPVDTVEKSGTPSFYARLESLITRFYPQALISPYLVMGGTDSRKYYAVTENVYRFTPILISDEERQLMHGTNERISTENYARMIQFFQQFIKEFTS